MELSDWVRVQMKILYPRMSRPDSEQQERNKWQGQNGPRVKMGCCCLSPERVKLTVNSKKEPNGRVKMGQKSGRAKSQDGLLLFTPPPPRMSQTNSEQQERNKQQGQNGLLFLTPE